MFKSERTHPQLIAHFVKGLAVAGFTVSEAIKAPLAAAGLNAPHHVEFNSKGHMIVNYNNKSEGLDYYFNRLLGTGHRSLVFFWAVLLCLSIVWLMINIFHLHSAYQNGIEMPTKGIIASIKLQVGLIRIYRSINRLCFRILLKMVIKKTC